MDELANLVGCDEERVRAVLEQCNGNKEEAILLLKQQSPTQGKAPAPTPRIDDLPQLEPRLYDISWEVKFPPLRSCCSQAIDVIKAGLVDKDPDAQRFLSASFDLAFDKLFCASALKQWQSAIIHNVIDSALECGLPLILCGLEYLNEGPCLNSLLRVLCRFMNPDVLFHSHHGSGFEPRHNVVPHEAFGKFSKRRTVFLYKKQPEMPWLCDIIDFFGYSRGFKLIEQRLVKATSIETFLGLLQPILKAVDNISTDYLLSFYSSNISHILSRMQSLKDEDMKAKGVTADISSVLKGLRKLLQVCSKESQEMSEQLDKLSLTVTERFLNGETLEMQIMGINMIKAMLESSTEIREWMSSKDIFQKVFMKKMHHSEYMKQCKNLVSCMADHRILTTKELDIIWEASLGEGKATAVVDNIHALLSKVAERLDTDQLEHLFRRFEHELQRQDADIQRNQKIMNLAKDLAINDRKEKMSHQTLGLLHRLAQDETDAPIATVKLALDLHSEILRQLVNNPKPVRDGYLQKCVESIQQGNSPVVSFMMLRGTLAAYPSGYDKARAAATRDLIPRPVDLTLKSLQEYMDKVRCCGVDPAQCNGNQILVGRFAHKDNVNERLATLAYLQREMGRDLEEPQIASLWETLVIRAYIPGDGDLLLQWLTDQHGLLSLQASEALLGILCGLGAEKMNSTLFSCFEAIFFSVNVNAHKLVMNSSGNIGTATTSTNSNNSSNHNNNPINKNNGGGRYVTLATDLKGLTQLWEIVLSADEGVANRAMDLLNSVYRDTKLNNVDVRNAHIESCMARIAAPSSHSQHVVRSLELLCRYIDSIESLWIHHRRHRPHGVSMQGGQITVNLEIKMKLKPVELDLHDTIGTLRQKAAERLKTSKDSVRLLLGSGWNAEEIRGNGRTLVKVGISHKAVVQADAYASSSSSSGSGNTTSSIGVGTTTMSSYTSSTTGSRNLQNSAGSNYPNRLRNLSSESRSYYDHDTDGSRGKEELELPGVILSRRKEDMETLFQLMSSSNDNVTRAVSALLQVIPTDAKLKEQLTVGKDIAKVFSIEESAAALLYRLQALEAVLMPLDDAGANGSQSSGVSRGFLSSGGMRQLLEIMQYSSARKTNGETALLACVDAAVRIVHFLLSAAIDSSSSSSACPGSSEDKLVRSLSMESGDIVLKDTDMVMLVNLSLHLVWAASGGLLWRETLTPKQMHDACLAQPRLHKHHFSIIKHCLDILHLCIVRASPSVERSASASTTTLLSSGGLTTPYPYDSKGDSTALDVFMNIDGVEQAIADLLSSHHPEVPDLARITFQSLLRVRNSEAKQLRQMVLKVLLTEFDAALAGHNQHCTAYFILLSKLIVEESHDGSWDRGVGPSIVKSEDVIGLLESWNTVVEDQALEGRLVGALNLLRALVYSDSASELKAQVGRRLMKKLVVKFLFPDIGIDAGGCPVVTLPLCSTKIARLHCYKLVNELTRNSKANLNLLCDTIVSNLHPDGAPIKWDMRFHSTDYFLANADGYVGLRNLGATCYMNSLLQQLYMNASVRAAIMATPEVELSKQSESTFYQLQRLFGFLSEGKSIFADTRTLCATIKQPDGTPLCVTRQEDAQEFMSRVFDTIEEAQKPTPLKDSMPQLLGCTTVQQVLSKECQHRSERDEHTLYLSACVRGMHSLEQALADMYTRPDLLEDDNKWKCEDCGKKVDALKRSCIKSLSQSLVIHLKRFDLDYETLEPVKLNDRFEFPKRLDMRPYTLAAIEPLQKEEDEESKVEYELVGVLVHSGRANGGHYYSFIRQRDRPDENDKPKWYRFDDRTVEVYDISHLERDTFGGKRNEMVWDSTWFKYVEQKVEVCYSAYILFYEKVNSQGVVPVGPAQGLTGSIPSSIMNTVRVENHRTMREGHVFDPAYFTFVREVVSSGIKTSPVLAAQIAARFLATTYSRAQDKLRTDLSEWKTVITDLLNANSAAARKEFLRFLILQPSGQGQHVKHSPFLAGPLLYTDKADARAFFADILAAVLGVPPPSSNDCNTSSGHHYSSSGSINRSSSAASSDSSGRHGELVPIETQDEETKQLQQRVLEEIIALVSVTAATHWKNVSEMFTLIACFASHSQGNRERLYKMGVLWKLIDWLLWEDSPDYRMEKNAPKREQMGTAYIYADLSSTVRAIDALVQGCNVNTTGSDVIPPYPRPQQQDPSSLIQISEKEATTLRSTEFWSCLLHNAQGCAATSSLVSQLSWYDLAYSTKAIDNLLKELATKDDSGTVELMQLLSDILLLNDPYRQQRLDRALLKSDLPLGVFAITKKLHADYKMKRAYAIFRSLIQLSTKCSLVKTMLIDNRAKWLLIYEWITNELKFDTEIREDYSNTQEMIGTKIKRTSSAKSLVDECQELLRPSHH